MTDLYIERTEGHFFILRPVSNAGRAWAAMALPDEMTWEGGIVVEPGHIIACTEAARIEGLTVE